MPSYEETSGDGSYANPFGNIVKAIEAGKAQVATMSGGTPTITIVLLGGGNHHMTMNPEHYTYSGSVKNDNNDFDMVIQPSF
jgi:hypothetical protein